MNNKFNFLKKLIGKVLIISMAVLLFACSTKQHNTAQRYDIKSLNTFKGDTAAFINEILKKKAIYAGKPLSVLLKDLSIPLEEFTTGTDFKDVNNSPHITIKFYNRWENDKKVENKQDPYNLVIVWANKVSREQADGIGRRSLFKWTPEAAEYFGKQIVGDIVKVDYFNPMK